MAHGGMLQHGALQLFLHGAARAGNEVAVFPTVLVPVQACSQVSSLLLGSGDGAWLCW